MNNILNLFKDNRNPIFFIKYFSKSQPHELPEEISFMFTMDVEIDREKNLNSIPNQVESTLNFIEDFGRATFFVDPAVAEKVELPQITKHEIGCHSYKHSAVGDNWWIKREDKKFEARFAIEKGTNLIKDYFNVKPVSFRAPKFSISQKIFKILEENNYKIDSSFHPHSCELLPRKISSILEIPISRIPKPEVVFRKFIPHLRFKSLMMSVLKDVGVDEFLRISKEILYYWNGKEKPILVFLVHNWEINAESINLLRDYFKELEKIVELKFIRMRDYL